MRAFLRGVPMLKRNPPARLVVHVIRWRLWTKLQFGTRVSLPPRARVVWARPD